jgi:hypothetical protein
MKIKLNNVFKPKKETEREILKMLLTNVHENKDDIVDKVVEALNKMMGLGTGDDHKSNTDRSDVFPHVHIKELDPITHAIRKNTPQWESLRLAMKDKALDSLMINVYNRGGKFYFKIYSDNALLWWYHNVTFNKKNGHSIPLRKFLDGSLQSIDSDDIKKVFK